MLTSRRGGGRELGEHRPGRRCLAKLATQTSVRTLQIGGEQVTDENLAYVGRMTGLEELNISWGYHLTDKGFLHLSGLKRLRILDVDHSKMTDAGLEAIGKLTNLEELRIGGAGFSDRGLAQLKGLTRLKYLSLGEGNHTISDAGLASLKGMKELEYLDLGGWHVGDEGIAKLRELKNLKSVRIELPEDQGDRPEEKGCCREWSSNSRPVRWRILLPTRSAPPGQGVRENPAEFAARPDHQRNEPPTVQ